jgi:hypothetical protein
VSLQTNRYSCSNAGPHPAHKSKMKKGCMPRNDQYFFKDFEYIFAKSFENKFDVFAKIHKNQNKTNFI